MNGPAGRPQVQKLHIYEGIFNLNRAFHATLLSLERLENLGVFKAEYLNACKIELEHTRANANDELIETLRDYEQDEGGRFYRMQKEWEDQLKDPDDVFLEAKSRKEEIRKQMKDLLQLGLERMSSRKRRQDKYAKGKHHGSDRYAATEVPQRQFSYSHCADPRAARGARRPV